MTENHGEEQRLRHETLQSKIAPGPGKEEVIPLGDRRKAVLRQELMVVLMNLGLLIGGMSLALPAVTLDLLTDPAQKFHLSKSLASWFASASSIACPIGSFSSFFLVDRIGRKNTMILSNLFGITSWALMSHDLSKDSELIFVQLIVSRIFSGIALGIGGSAGSVYGAEVGLPKMRARLTMVTSMALALGILFAYVVGFFFRDDWRLIGITYLIYQIGCLVILIPVKETPYWLLSKGRVEEAKSSLSYFRGLDAGETHEEVETEFNLLMQSSRPKYGERKVNLWKSLHVPDVYKPLIISVFFFAFQQFSGTFVVVVYAVQIITKAGVRTDPFLCAIYVGIARFIVASVVMTWQLERWGRRPVGIFAASSTAVCLFLLAASSWFTWLQIPTFSAILIVVFVFASAGLWNIPFLILPEIYPQKVRGAFCAASIAICHLIAFFAIKVYPYMVDAIGSGNVFACYGIAAFLTIVFIHQYVPETKGKTFTEIEEYFRSKSKAFVKANGTEATEVFVVQNK